MKNSRKVIRRATYIVGRHNEKTTGPSMTIPGETYTIRELLQKHTRGILPPGIHREAIYDDDSSFDSPDYQKINNSDIQDRHALKQKAEEDFNSLLQTNKEKQIIKTHPKEKKSNKQENTEQQNKDAKDATTKEAAKEQPK